MLFLLPSSALIISCEGHFDCQQQSFHDWEFPKPCSTSVINLTEQAHNWGSEQEVADYRERHGTSCSCELPELLMLF